MSLSGIGSRLQLGGTATHGVAREERSDARTSASGSPGVSTGLIAAGAVGVLGGLGLKLAGLNRLGIGAMAVGGALLGVSLLAACGGPKGPPVPGDEGEPGGSVSMFPGTLRNLPTDSDTTNPAPADYVPRSGSRDAREGVVLLSVRGATGSGWVIEPGTIVTNYHVAHGNREVTVTDHAGRKHDGVVRKLDRQHDLAIVDAPTLRDRPLELDDTVDSGELGETTGYPHGSFSNDAATALGEITVDDDGRERQALVFSGRSAEGVSGGAVINGAGEVLGTSFAVGELPADDDSDATPFVLAIPNDQVREFLAAPTPALPAER